MGERAPGGDRSLRLGIELGLTLVDPTEMYAEGGAEELVGEAVQGLRNQVFLSLCPRAQRDMR
jgi:aryl-alcohol dehydrogenase-like predicted oxidoreductase